MLDSIIAFALVLVTAGLIFFFALPQTSSQRFLRPLPAFTQLRKAIGLAVENGSRIHISIGKATPSQTLSAAGLIGLATLERIAQVSSISDRPPVATSGDGTLTILSQDTLRAAYRMANALDSHDPARGRLTGITPFSYVAGTLPIADSENVSAHILAGNFGPEIALLVEAAERENAFTLASSDSLPAQAALYASAQEPLIGEELFAIPAYLNAGRTHSASLRTQDILRWGVIVVITGGAILKLLGIL
jgi:hypothetical protein